MTKKKNDLKSIYSIIFLTFLIHLASINFHPTNFEGGYGAFANFFNYEDKVLFLTAYFNTQFNTYIFSWLGSIINSLLPFIDGYHSVKLLSASSYFFLCFGIFNILEFYKYKDNRIFFILVVLFNSIIWNYGFRAYNDLFAFSLAIYFFSKILITSKSNFIYVNSFILGFAIILKSYNLILLIPIYFLLFFEDNKKSILNIKIINVAILITLPLIIYNLFTYKYLGFLFAPKSEDLQFALIGSDSTRNIFWVLNNFIFYIGYLTLISFPFSIVFFLKLKNKLNKYDIINFILIISFSIYLQKFFFISSELDLGPLQKFIPENFYKAIILINFLFFIYLMKSFITVRPIDKKKFKISLIIIFTILSYLLALSFIKASQRYLILPLPFFFLFLFNVIQPRVLIFTMLIIYTLFNSLLLMNYYITSKSTDMIFKYLKNEKILENTVPGRISPHVHHLYDNCSDFKHSEKCSGYIKGRIKLVSSDYRVVDYKENSIFSSKIKLLGIEFNKFSVIKLK